MAVTCDAFTRYLRRKIRRLPADMKSDVYHELRHTLNHSYGILSPDSFRKPFRVVYHYR